MDFTHIFTSEALRRYQNLYSIPRYQFIVNNSRCIVFCIDTKQRITHNGFSQITLLIPLAHAFVYCVFYAASFKVYVLSDFQKYYGHTGILANGNHIFPRNFQIFQKLSQNLFCQRLCLFLVCIFHSLVHIRCQIVIGLYAHFFNILCQKFYVYAANHTCSYLSVLLWLTA